MLALNKQLQTLLGKSITYLEEILDTLYQERLAMVRDQQQTLLTLISQKTEKIDQLADLDHEMTTLLLQHAPNGSMTDYLEQTVPPECATRHEKLRALWEYYVRLLSACRDKNSTNSQAVHLRLQQLHNEHSLLSSQRTASGMLQQG